MNPILPNIPIELLEYNPTLNDLSILIGENGTGKSTLLNQLSRQFLSKGKNVIAIANSIHDKFESSHSNFRTLRGRSGRKMARGTIKKALENIANSENIKFKEATKALEYVGFDTSIGLRIEKLNSNYLSILSSSDLPEDTKNIISSLLLKAGNESPLDEIIWLYLNDFNFSDFERISLLKLLLWERKLKSLKIIERIEIFLRKNGQTISMLEASSGEIILITSIVYISTSITEDTVILIDEPENSLHPKWQKEYAKTILDLFYLYQPKVIIATHSPIIVNGAELFIKESRVFKGQDFTFTLQPKEPLNVEELLFKLFDINTPQSRYISERIVRLLNLVAANKLSVVAFEIEIDRVVGRSYDPKQIEVLNSMKDVAAEITAKD